MTVHFSHPLFSTFWVWLKHKHNNYEVEGSSYFYDVFFLSLISCFNKRSWLYLLEITLSIVSCSNLFSQCTKGLTITQSFFLGHSFVWLNNKTVLWSFSAPTCQRETQNFFSPKIFIRVACYFLYQTWPKCWMEWKGPRLSIAQTNLL